MRLLNSCHIVWGGNRALNQGQVVGPACYRAGHFGKMGVLYCASHRQELVLTVE